MSLGLAMHIKFGIRLAVKDDQYKKLASVFDMKEACKDDGSTFCVKLPSNRERNLLKKDKHTGRC